VRFIGAYFVSRCRRIEILVCPGDLSSLVRAQVMEEIFVEAVDVFCALVAKPEMRLKVLEFIGKSCWDLADDRIVYFHNIYRPSLQTSQSEFTVGRVTLPLVAEKVHTA